MKLVLLTGRLSNQSGGLSSSVPGLAAALLEMGGSDVHIVGVSDRAHPAAWREWGEYVHPHSEFGSAKFHWSPAMGNTLADLAPDLVDSQGLWTYQSLVNLRWQKLSRSRYIITPRGMLDPWALRYSHWKKRVVSWWFEAAHLRDAACLRATASLEAIHFRDYGLRNPIAIVPNGIGLQSLEPRPIGRPHRRRVLFLSRLHPKKGLDYLLRAWAKLIRRHHEDWELVIAGPDEGGHRAAMQRLAAHLGTRNVIWNEPVHGEDKSALYRSADLFVLPTHAENFGLVVAEALAHEVPVLTTRNAPWDGLDRHDCGWWIDLTDEALLQALDEALSLTDAERHAMGGRGRAWMERDFAWPAVARQMHEVYTWVLGGGPPPSCVMTD